MTESPGTPVAGPRPEPAARTPRRRTVRGAASVEYALVSAAVVLALFVVPVTPSGRSAVGFVLEALGLFQHNTTYLLSLP